MGLVRLIYPINSPRFSTGAISATNAKNAVEKAVAAAEEGMKNTIPMVAKKGRASYLGERSRGHQDPGATSVYLMLKTFHESLVDS